VTKVIPQDAVGKQTKHERVISCREVSALSAIATSEVAVRKAQQSRTRLLVWPREHGAWGILLVPFFTGAGAGLARAAHIPSLLLLAVAALSLFCLRTPVESLMGTSPMRAQSAAERRTVISVIVVFTAISIVASLALLWSGNFALVLMGGVAAGLFLAQVLVKRLGRRGRMPAQLVGALGLTLTAPAAYYVLTAKLDSLAFGLWLANWFFAANQIHFVQLRIRGARLGGWSQKFAAGKGFLTGQLALLLLVAACWRAGLLPGLALLAFIPALFRGSRWFVRATEPLDVHRLGYSELAHAIAFGILFIAAVRLRM
jgi:hypothetical protein